MSIGFALLLGFAMVLVIEGIVLSLMPKRVEDMLRVFAQIPIETRRIIGLSVVALGVVLVALILGIS
jgi:uncharacterized protein YjeT (DUF2065 family)